VRYVNKAIMAIAILAVIIGAVAGVAVTAQVAITVSTDKDVYRPGEVVVITGTAPANSYISITVTGPKGDVDFKIVKSDANGVYRYEMVLPPTIPYGEKWAFGEYTVKAQISTYTATTTFRLAPLATVTGVVVDESNNPVAGAEISVVETGTTTHTDASGCFQLYLSEGTYTIRVSKAGFISREITVEAKVGINDVGTIQLISIESIVTSLQTSIDKLNTAISDLSSKVEDLSSKLETISGKVEEIGTTVAELSALSSTVKELETKVKELTDELSGLSSELSKLKDTVDSVSSDLGTITGDVSTLKAKVDELSSKISDLESKLGTLESSLKSVEGKASSNADEISKLKSVVDDLKSRIKTLEGLTSTINSLQGTIGSLQKSIENFQKTVEDLTKKASAASDQASAIAGQLPVLYAISVIGLIIALVAVFLVYRKISG